MSVRLPRILDLAVFIFVLSPALAVGCGYQSAPARGDGPGRRHQVLALSPAQELQLGRQAYKQVLSKPREFGRALPTDHPDSRRVHGIAQRIISAAGIDPLQREINLRTGYRFEWEVNVLDQDRINAFCLPGGKMVVFQGIIKVAQNDSQLATVISHEISHALAHHSSERVARQDMDQSGIGAIWSKSFDRQEEAEADHIGLFLMTFAGFDPDEALRFWVRMKQTAGNQPQLPEILSDHPSDARRIQDMQGWIPKARAAKQAFDEGRIAPATRR